MPIYTKTGLYVTASTAKQLTLAFFIRDLVNQGISAAFRAQFRENINMGYLYRAETAMIRGSVEYS